MFTTSTFDALKQLSSVKDLFTFDMIPRHDTTVD